MKRLLLLSLLVIVFVPAMAQNNNGTISGKVLETSGSAVSFATMVLLNSDSVMVKADYTRDDGAFSFANIPSGSYRVQLRSIQFEPYISKIFELGSGENLKLPTITAKTAVTQLENVQVTAARPLVEVQPDKTVFNVENSVNATGNDALELLRKAPGVIVDNNDNVILQGKSGVRIYIDGKPTQLRGEDLVAMLRSMRSEDMESIEIITNPSAKYDAEGNAGIINLKLKRDKNLGLNATLTAGYDIGIHDRYNGGINFNYRNKKKNVFGSYNHYDNGGENNVDLEKQLNGFFLDQRSKIIWKNKGNNFRFGSDYFINKKHVLGFVVNGTISERKTTNTSTTPIGSLNTGIVDQILQADNVRNFSTDNFGANINYQFKGEKGTSINVDADYGYYWNTGGTYQPNVYTDPTGEVVELERIFSDDQLTRIDIKTFKVDYERPLGKGKLSAGIKWSDVETQNNFDFFSVEGDVKTRDIDRSSDFNYREKVAAAYATYFTKLSEKVTFSGGVRMEHTDSDGRLESDKVNQNDRVAQTYTDLFPSGGFTYQLNKMNKFALNYSRRIDRPSYQDLNPFEFKLDELTFQQGNPFLSPQYTHSFQLSHTYKYRLNTQLSFSATNNFFAQVVDTTGQKGSLLKQQNIADAKNYGLNISYPFDVNKWWSVYGNFNLFHATYDANIEGVRINLDATTYNIFVQNNFVLPSNFRVELSGWYNSPSIWGGTFLTERMWSMSFGVRKSIWKDRGQIRFQIADIFRTQEWEGRSDYGGLVVNGNGGNDSRRFKFGFTYRIGNQEVKAARKRKTGLEAEKNRIKEN
ncbi:TonB-dependent receptor [Fulvivirgaceae bacterium BMA10]|uniref:TonB-dependent receptor n=1 Tax=Splendidivirga corallicola TaxID=3051826 RepID=A0ABT8KUF4_9BACT|nr:TonB-dependent receptor [Fulvivirgaceae bacterium BMA10]